MPSTNVVHNTAAHRFEVPLENGDFAVAEYFEAGSSIVFTHTYVPPEGRNRGLAELLVRAALEWCQAQGLKVVPQCSYVARFIDRHAEYRGLLASDVHA